MINNVFEGIDIRDELDSYLHIPPRFRFVNMKETKPVYEKLCKEYKKKNSTEQVVVQQKQKTPVQPILQVRQKQKQTADKQQN